MDRYLDLTGRLLVAALFATGAIQKAIDPGAVQGLLAGMGWPEFLIWPAALLNAAGAVALAAGWRLRAVALVLAAYCGVASVFHWLPGDGWQMSIFVKNWAIAGGLLCLAARTGRLRVASA